MTTNRAKAPDQDIQWFFTAEESRYELAEVLRLTRCSKDDIQNWVRRGMIAPDETTPGRRIYLPRTLAELVIAAHLRNNGTSALYALMIAKVITLKAFEWYAGKELSADEMPSDFTGDFRNHYATFVITPTPERPYATVTDGVKKLPGVVYVEILPHNDVPKALVSPCVTVVRLHWLWQLMADIARDLKARPSKRLPPEGQVQ